MKSVVEQILQWPLIVQGALGSALFWLILTLGGRMVRWLGAQARGLSRKRRLDMLHAEAIRLHAFTNESQQTSIYAFAGLIYMATQYVMKGLAAICLGLIFASIFPVFGIVGFVMALYYLLYGGSIVRDVDLSKIDAKAELERIDKEVAELESKT